LLLGSCLLRKDDNPRPWLARAVLSLLYARIHGGEVVATPTPGIFIALLARYFVAHGFSCCGRKNLYVIDAAS